MLGLFTLTEMPQDRSRSRSLERSDRETLERSGRETRSQTGSRSGAAGVVDISPETIAAMTKAVKQSLSKEIERSNKHYYEKGRVESQLEFDKYHMYSQLQERVQRQDSMIDGMHEYIHGLQHKLELQERETKEPNLIIRGVPEVQADATKVVLDSFPQVSAGRIVEAVRMGRPQPQSSTRPRPILVKFVGAGDKHLALKSARTLRAKQVYLDMHLTEMQLKAKMANGARYRELRAQGAKPFWRYARLFYTSANGRVVEEGGPPPMRGPAPPSQPHLPPPPPASGGPSGLPAAGQPSS